MPADKAKVPPQLEALAEVVALSGQMIEAARAADWDRVAALELRRSGLLAGDLLARIANSPAARSAETKTLLATCLRLNDEITALAGAHMARLGELLALMSQVSASGQAPPAPDSNG